MGLSTRVNPDSRPVPGCESRRDFLRKLMVGLTATATMFRSGNVFAETFAVPTGRASWARLVTPSPFWGLHSEQDAAVAEFMSRESHLKLDSTNYAVNPASLEELTAFPFIFTNSLTAVVESKQQDNLKEYLQRGGFFYVEGCLDHRMNRSFAAFMEAHLALFEKFAPGSQVRRLGPAHAIFHAYFPVEENKLSLIEATEDDLRWQGAPQSLYGIYQQNRMISLISLEHLQCEWFTKPDKVPFCLRQIANIYVYAMTR